jgi:hypothetical protein
MHSFMHKLKLIAFFRGHISLTVGPGVARDVNIFNGGAWIPEVPYLSTSSLYDFERHPSRKCSCCSIASDLSRAKAGRDLYMIWSDMRQSHAASMNPELCV